MNAEVSATQFGLNPGPAGTKCVVILSGFRIFPATTGGHVRTSGIAAALARLGYRVVIYSLAGRNDDYGLAGALGPSFRLDHIGPNLSEETNLGLLYGLAQAVGRRLDYPRVWQQALLARAVIPGRLKAVLAEADIVLSDMPWCPKIPGPWSAKPWFLISHNLEHRLLEQGTPSHQRYAAWMRELEAQAPRVYRDIFVCAEEDRDFFRGQPGGADLKLPSIPCCVDPAAYVVAEGTRERIRHELGLAADDHLVVFSGSNFGPNADALRSVRSLFSEARAELARRRIFLLILGSMSPTPFREGQVIATGRVPTVPPYFAAADAGLNPVTRGSGANVKLFEYVAAGLPVISTPFGVRGAGLQADVDYLAYDPPELRGALERFTTLRSAAEWKTFAADVWRRHRSTFDINEAVRRALAQRPEFSGSAG